VRTVAVSWDRAADRFTARGTHPGHELTVNAPRPPDAPGPPTGFSPTELLLGAVGSCSAWDVVEIARKARMAVTGIDVAVSGVQAADPPWPYERVELHFTIRGSGLRRPQLERAVRLSTDRYCSVIATIRGVTTVTWTLDVVDEAAETRPSTVTEEGDGARAPQGGS
jgi:putative redox protein